MMSSNNIDYQLTVAVEKFVTNYKEKLNEHESSLDKATFNALYDLGAIIRHAFDDVQKIIVETQEK